MTRIAANGRCKFHGGHSTGPRTQEGRNRIARAQRARWRLWHAANPRLFPDITPGQERTIKRAYRQRQAKRNPNSWIERELGENWREIMEEQRQEFEMECARTRERNKPLTPEQNAEADKFLEHWAKVTKQPLAEAREELYMLDDHGYMVRNPGPSQSEQWVSQMLEHPTTRPVNTSSEQVPIQARHPAHTTSQKLEAQIARQPIARTKRLEYQERQEALQAHGEELIARYGIDRSRRPTVKVGHAHKKRR